MFILIIIQVTLNKCSKLHRIYRVIITNKIVSALHYCLHKPFWWTHNWLHFILLFVSVSFWLNSTDVCAIFRKRIWEIPKFKQHSWLDWQCPETVSSNITLQFTLSSKTLSISHSIYLVKQTTSIWQIEFSSTIYHIMEIIKCSINSRIFPDSIMSSGNARKYHFVSRSFAMMHLKLFILWRLCISTDRPISLWQ